MTCCSAMQALYSGHRRRVAATAGALIFLTDVLQGPLGDAQMATGVWQHAGTWAW